MFLMIYHTDRLVILDGVGCRLWVGLDPDGRVYDVLVHRVGSDDPYAQELLVRELQTRNPPEDAG